MAFPPSPPDFLNAFGESVLIIAKEGWGDVIDLSAKEVCYDGLVSFGKAFTSASNKSCDANSTSSVSCVLTDGLAYANLSLKIFDDCPKIPLHPPALQEPRQLYLAIWVPILGVLIIGILIGLAVFAFIKISQKYKVQNGKEPQDPKSSFESSYETLNAERGLSISSTETEISIISNSPSIYLNTLDFSPNLHPSRVDSAFSSMKTLGTILEVEDSIPDENVYQDLRSESCHDLKIIYSRSTTTLSDVVFLDVDESNNESSTDATLRRPREESKGKDEESAVG